MTRQRKWQLKKKAEGKCTICGKHSESGKELCVEHIIKRRNYVRKKFGHKPKQEGKVGRNIKYKEPLNA